MMQATHSTSSSTKSQLSQLPAALTAHILQFVPQQERMSCCALVCSAWRAAAALATVHIDCRELSLQAAAALAAWLEQHGEQVQSLELRNVWSQVLLQLQLPLVRLLQLQSLHLAFMQLPDISGSNSSAPAADAAGGSSSSGSGQTGNVPLLPHLTQLQLENCRLHSLDSLTQLVTSTGLTSLAVDDCRFSAPVVYQQRLDPALLLQRLPQLLVLRLPHRIRLSRTAIKHVAGMRSLQHLQLSLDEQNVSGDCFADLPSSLTRLQLWDRREYDLTLEQPTLQAPQLQRLSRLQQLHLESCSLSPAVLASVPQLQHVELDCCILLPCQRDRRQNPAATAALLDALQQLTRLQHLEMLDVVLDPAGPPPQQWAALTASTQLTCLTVSMSDEDGQPLPQGAAQHMFPAGRQLQLHKLVLQSRSQWEGEWCISGPDLGRITSCCPQLQELNVGGTVRAGADVSVLLQLPSSCSSLSIGGARFADADATVVTQLTQLRDFSWEKSPELSDLGLQQLTALQGLSHLGVYDGPALSSSIWEAAGSSGFDATLELTSTDDKGPVWQQLQAICERAPDCAAVSLKQARSHIQALQQQLAESQAQLAEREAQLAESQAQVQVLQRQVGQQP